MLIRERLTSLLRGDDSAVVQNLAAMAPEFGVGLRDVARAAGDDNLERVRERLDPRENPEFFDAAKDKVMDVLNLAIADVRDQEIVAYCRERGG